MKCCDTTAGQLRHTIDIVAQVRAPDGAGGAAVTWASIATLKAKIVPKGGGERYAFDRTAASVTHEITTRFLGDIKPEHRVLFNGRMMRILRVINVEERNRWLVMQCDEREAEQ